MLLLILLKATPKKPQKIDFRQLNYINYLSKKNLSILNLLDIYKEEQSISDKEIEYIKSELL